MEEPENLIVEENSCNQENPEGETNNQEEIKNQELLVMTVEIGDGRQDIIVIYENDDPVQLASDFAKKHSLDASLTESLARLIRHNKELVENKAKAGTQNPGKISDFFGSYLSQQNPKESSKMEEPENPIVEGNSCNQENPEEETNNQEEIKNQELLVMTVEIGDGRQDIIVIYENDDPVQLASDFAKKHSLDASFTKSLAGLIRHNKELVENKAKAGTQDPGKISDFFGSYLS